MENEPMINIYDENSNYENNDDVREYELYD